MNQVFGGSAIKAKMQRTDWEDLDRRPLAGAHLSNLGHVALGGTITGALEDDSQGAHLPG